MRIPEIVPPRTREDLTAAFEKLHADANSYWNAFDTQAFFRRLGEAWSPADNVRHLTKSTRPVALALKVPKIVLRFKFGKPRRPSASFEQVRDRYDALTGKDAGKFAPSSRAESDLEAWRRQIMQERAAANAQLVAGVRRWSERALDACQLPHPLLGLLTVREMLFFTLYHQVHHISGVERRRAL